MPLIDAVPRSRRRREDLADPVGDDIDRPHVRLDQPLPPPSYEIGAHDVVFREPDVHLGKDPPPARASEAVVVVERPADEPAERALRPSVARKRCRHRDDFSAKHLETSPLFN